MRRRAGAHTLPLLFLASLPPGARGLNRLLFDARELDRPGGRRVTIGGGDARARHVVEILRRGAGDQLRVGQIDGGASDAAVLLAVGADGALAIELDRPLDAEPPPQPRPRVDLLLALPRPLQLERILPVVAQLGVGTLVLAGARKVERAYWGSALLRDSDGAARTRAALVDGLEQCGDTALPRVARAKYLRRWLEREADGFFPRDRVARIAAHPQRADAPRAPRFGDAAAAARPPGGGDGRLLIAVGPEGGWEEPEELELLEAHGFTIATLGERVLRSDVAVVSLLALAHEAVRRWDEPDALTL
jgi:RsmE family RNA methyltransferase